MHHQGWGNELGDEPIDWYNDPYTPIQNEEMGYRWEPQAGYNNIYDVNNPMRAQPYYIPNMDGYGKERMMPIPQKRGNQKQRKEKLLTEMPDFHQTEPLTNFTPIFGIPVSQMFIILFLVLLVILSFIQNWQMHSQLQNVLCKLSPTSGLTPGLSISSGT